MRLRCPVCGASIICLAEGTAPINRDDEKIWMHRLAHALVSDIELYESDRLSRARMQDTILSEFATEIHQAWSEFKTRSGRTDAGARGVFTQAVNEILARGKTII